MIAVAASVFLKFVTRNDLVHEKSFRKEDLAVGLDIAVTALLLFIAEGSKLATRLAVAPNNVALQAKLADAPWIIAAFILGIWGVSTLVRKAGWEDEEQLKPVLGIAIPDCFGIASLLLVVNWIA